MLPVRQLLHKMNFVKCELLLLYYFEVLYTLNTLINHPKIVCLCLSVSHWNSLTSYILNLWSHFDEQLWWYSKFCFQVTIPLQSFTIPEQIMTPTENKSEQFFRTDSDYDVAPKYYSEDAAYVIWVCLVFSINQCENSF